MSRDDAPPHADARPVRIDPNRWRPTRAGLLNVWQYTDEVLEFERGRMVLFGPNGSGKTMALELLLPHLLDAKGQPIRLSTSGVDRGGLWERVTGYDPGEARTGYVWVEFRQFRQVDDATFTLGVRLRANPSGGGEKTWFTTSQRVGVDLSLLDDNRRPLSIEQLKAAVEPAGRVWGSDTSGYRHAVRTTLFAGWSEDRLDALISTLLVVRKQDVSDGLSPARLSDLLSEALPPLDDLELGRVAEGFADLDRRRDHIARLKDDVAATERLAHAHRAYARAITAGVVGDVVGATTSFDNVARDLRKLRTELDAARQLQAELDACEETLESERQSLAGEREGLERSDAYRKGAELTDLREATEQAGRLSREANERAQRERADADKRREQADEAEERTRLATDHAAGARRELTQTVVALGGPLSDDVADDAVSSVVQAWLDGRLRAIRLVREKLRDLEVAKALRDEAAHHKSDCEGRLTDAEERLRRAHEHLDVAERAWRKAIADWRAVARELGPLLDTLDDPAAAADAVARARTLAREPLIEERKAVTSQSAELGRTLDELGEELRAYQDGKEPVPEPPAGRRDRSGVPGAPLWRLLRFVEGTPTSVRDAVESALGDSRLLDAWMSPDGSVSLGEGDADVVLVAGFVDGASRSSDSWRTIADVLEPDPVAGGVDAAMMRNLLTSVALVDGAAHRGQAPATGLVIGCDGTWRTARLAGRADVHGARYIGAASREAERLARIDALAGEIAGLEGEREKLHARLAELGDRLERCDQEQKTFPRTTEIADASRAVADEAVLVESAKQALHDATQRLLQIDGRVRDCLATLMQTATKHELPSQADRLDAVEAGVERVRPHLTTFGERLATHVSATREAKDKREIATDADARAAGAADTAAERRREHQRTESRYRAVEKATGADYHDVVERIARITARQSEIVGEGKKLRVEKSAVDNATGRLGNALEETERRRMEAERTRAAAHEAFVALCGDGVVRDAELEIEPPAAALRSVTDVLEAARRLRAVPDLVAAPDEAERTKMHNRVMDRLHAASQQLAGRADLTFEPEKRPWAVLRARREGLVTSAPELRHALREDLLAAQSELSEKERELFEEILSGSIREHLKDRLWAAQGLIDRINALLGQIESASGGVRVQLRWEIDPDLAETVELRKAKELLLHDSPIAEGRRTLDAFLRGRIERVRADDSDTGDWRDRLQRMLDYRAWHRFQILVHHTRFGDRPRPLASRNVSLSAGEKTIVMVLPLLAAVTAHYEPAKNAPPCTSPRFLLMDELFPKLDLDNKRQLLGLLPLLDLDAVFTSDKDRCEYDTLDGIAIHVFQRLRDGKTTTTRLVWNGSHTKVEMPTATNARAKADVQRSLAGVD